MSRLARWAAGWLIPPKVQQLLQRCRDAVRERHSTQLEAGNSVLRNVHFGERCFVLCNGPSVLKQDLRLLEGETVISVSNGYHHPLYGSFRPRYHCLPQVTYDVLTEDEAVDWFREMHASLGSAELILSCTEEPLVRHHGLFPGRVVRYVKLSEDMDRMPGREIPDLAAPIPHVQSVSVLCLMVAMYLGFRTIYLLGVDHDQFRTGTYTYFYAPTVLRGKDTTVGADGRVRTSHYDEFQALARLWRQYRHLREVAAANGVEIFNATAGGELDEFPRVGFESLFSGTTAQLRQSG
jgi:hypothetical protein